MRNGFRPGLALGIGIVLLGPTTYTSLATPVDRELVDRVPRVIHPDRSEKNMIALGRNLFFNDTFEGNDRTLGTYHPATNNFTIDPDFVADLPAVDSLFHDVPGPEDPDLLRRSDALKPTVETQICAQPKKEAMP